MSLVDLLLAQAARGIGLGRMPWSGANAWTTVTVLKSSNYAMIRELRQVCSGSETVWRLQVPLIRPSVPVSS